MMIVVAIVGVLAAVAVPAFFKYIKKSKSSEVPAVFAELKLKQEQYNVENSLYLSTSPDEATMHPAAPAGSRDAVAIEPLPLTWQTLRVKPPKNNVYCSYVSIAGTAGSLVGVGAEATAFGMTAAPAQSQQVVERRPCRAGTRVTARCPSCVSDGRRQLARAVDACRKCAR